MAKKNNETMLDAAISSLESKYGNGAVLNQESLDHSVEFIPTGCASLDYVIGGGIPRGRVIEVYGKPSSGKTTMSLFIAGRVQQAGGRVAFIDVEQAYDNNWAKLLGVDTDPQKFIVSQPSTVEESFDIVRTLTATNCLDLILIDSVEAMIPSKELEDGALEKDSIGVKARLLNKYLRVLTAEAAKTKTAIIFINQTRALMNVFRGPTETTPGGNALKFYSSVRLSVTKGEAITGEGKEQIGNVVKVTARKNKIAPPFRVAELVVKYTEGIDVLHDLLNVAKNAGVITLNGNTYYYGKTKLGVGKEKAKQILREDKALYDKITHAIQTADVSSRAAEVEPDPGE